MCTRAPDATTKAHNGVNHGDDSDPEADQGTNREKVRNVKVNDDDINVDE